MIGPRTAAAALLAAALIASPAAPYDLHASPAA